MPVLSICPERGCGALTPGGRCEAHRRHGDPRRHEKQKAQGRDSRYWREQLRPARLEFDEYTCQRCFGERCGNQDLTVHLDPALEGDHLSATIHDCVTVGRSCHGTVDAPRSSR